MAKKLSITKKEKNSIENKFYSMEILKHLIANTQITEIKSNKILIQNSDDGLNIMGGLYYQGYDKIIMYDKNISPDFLDFKE